MNTSILKFPRMPKQNLIDWRVFFFAVIPLLFAFPIEGKSQTAAKDYNLLLMHSKSAQDTVQSRTVSSSFYRKFISPQLGTSCVYEIECHDFRKGLFSEFGMVKASFLTIDRWGRCTHISTMDTFPVRLNQYGKIIESPHDYLLH